MRKSSAASERHTTVALNTQRRVSFARVADVCRDLMNPPLNPKTVHFTNDSCLPIMRTLGNALRRNAARLRNAWDEVKSTAIWRRREVGSASATGVDEADIAAYHQSNVVQETLFNVNTQSTLYVSSNGVGCANLQDKDPEFQLGVVRYSCYGVSQNVVTIQSTVDDSSSRDHSTISFLCAAPDITKDDDSGNVTVEAMEPIPLVTSETAVELDLKERRFFFMEHCETCGVQLRSTAFDRNLYLTVERRESESSGRTLQCCKPFLKRFASDDVAKYDPAIKFKWKPP